VYIRLVREPKMEIPGDTSARLRPAIPFDVDHRDQAVGQDGPDGGAKLEILEFGRTVSSCRADKHSRILILMIVRCEPRYAAESARTMHCRIPTSAPTKSPRAWPNPGEPSYIEWFQCIDAKANVELSHLRVGEQRGQGRRS